MLISRIDIMYHEERKKNHIWGLQMYDDSSTWCSLWVSLSVCMFDVPPRFSKKGGIESCDCNRVNCGYNDGGIT